MKQTTEERLRNARLLPPTESLDLKIEKLFAEAMEASPRPSWPKYAGWSLAVAGVVLVLAHAWHPAYDAKPTATASAPQRQLFYFESTAGEVVNRFDLSTDQTQPEFKTLVTFIQKLPEEGHPNES